MRAASDTKPTGDLGLRIIKPNGLERPAGRPGKELTLAEINQYTRPQRGLPEEVNDFRSDNRRLYSGKFLQMVASRASIKAAGRAFGGRVPYFWSQLWLAKILPDGTRLDFGLAGVRVVTDAGVNYIVDAFQNTQEVENFNFHGIGTDNTAEASGDTALGTELTTQYNPDNTRATGTQGEGASANIYQTVGTNAVDAAVAIVEHGVLTQAATGGGTLLDRTVFAVVNLANGESLESTYELTVNSGG